MSFNPIYIYALLNDLSSLDEASTKFEISANTNDATCGTKNERHIRVYKNNSIIKIKHPLHPKSA